MDETHDKGNGAISGAVNGAVNDGVKISRTQRRVMEAIGSQPGINARRLANLLGLGTSTVDRSVRMLKDLNLIEFSGAPKTGGYFLK